MGQFVRTSLERENSRNRDIFFSTSRREKERSFLIVDCSGIGDGSIFVQMNLHTYIRVAGYLNLE